MERAASSVSHAGLGLTMSEEGGLEEVEEFLATVARSSPSLATSACKASTWVCRSSTHACKRAQLAQGVGAVSFMRRILSHRPTRGSIPVNGYPRGLVQRKDGRARSPE